MNWRNRSPLATRIFVKLCRDYPHGNCLNLDNRRHVGLRNSVCRARGLGLSQSGRTREPGPVMAIAKFFTSVSSRRMCTYNCTEHEHQLKLITSHVRHTENMTPAQVLWRSLQLNSPTQRVSFNPWRRICWSSKWSRLWGKRQWLGNSYGAEWNVDTHV